VLAARPRAVGMGWLKLDSVVESGQPRVLEEIPGELLDGDGADEEIRGILRELAPTSVITVPLVIRSRVSGTLSLGSAAGGRRLGTNDLPLLSELARRAAGALDNALLFEREQDARARLTAAVRARDEMLAVVAHDLRSPLSAISIFASLIQDSDTPNKQAQHARTILGCTDQMNRLIQGLLEIARIEAGYLHITPEPLEPAALIADVAQVLQEKAATRGLRLDAVTPVGVSTVNADRYRLRQVLSNLVENAIRATPSGGSIALGVEEDGEEVVFRVRDTGPGIPQEQHAHLFRPFWQGRRGDRDGAGLGLAIATGIVHAHGGRIWVESAPGEGSTFFFSLPSAPQADGRPSIPPLSPPLSPPAQAAPHPAAPIRVMLVDDHPVILLGLERSLSRFPGIQIVAQATTGEEALGRIAAARPQVVVMDLAMEGMGGLDAIRFLSATHPDIRLLALTSESEDEALLPVLAAGAHGFLSKTDAQESLGRAIETVAADKVFLYPNAARLLLQGYRDAERRAVENIERLTAEERDLIRLLAEGYSSKEIGDKLHLARSTVDSYRSELMQRLALDHRSELVKLALRTGMLDGG
jgi:signal transduction histidine kinase/DNA-binding NarL/FixJ family response regulator